MIEVKQILPFDAPGRLNARQHQVFKLLGEGRKTSEISGLLKISKKTVYYHCARIYSVFRINNSIPIIQWYSGFKADLVPQYSNRPLEGKKSKTYLKRPDKYNACECGRAKMKKKVVCVYCNGERKRMQGLSDRQKGFIAFWAFGMPTKLIAKETKLKVETVRAYLVKIQRKLGFHSAQEITRYAIFTGLIPNMIWPLSLV